MTINISVIIPVFKEEAGINTTIASLLKIKGNHDVEIIVVDGDSSGSTIECITEPGVIPITSQKGRAFQMNKGASIAAGDILLFLHADTVLPEKGFDKIEAVMNTGKYAAGAFNYAITSKNLFLRHIYYTSYLRSRLSRIAYGDQAIFIRKDYFKKINGFPEIPIMEDVALMKIIKKNKDKIFIIKDGVITSTRRYEEEGIIHGWLRNHRLRFLYFLGVSPERLSKHYPDIPGQKHRRGLVLFLKYPQKGEIKTRLAKVIGAAFTVQLYECFIRDLVEKTTSLPYDFHVFVAPRDKVAAMRTWLAKDLPVHAQAEGDLGQRMKQAFEKMFSLGYESCVLIGSDSPDLPISVLADAFENLETSEAVLAPAADGGYYLLGFQRRHFCKAVFENIDWSTDRVFQQTLDIFTSKKTRVKILRQWWDVDNYNELVELWARNRDSESRTSHTMRFLSEHEEDIFTRQTH